MTMINAAALVAAFGVASATALAIEPREPTVADCPGYVLKTYSQTENAFYADLKLAGTPCNIYGQDLQDLQLVVEYQTVDRLHVLIKDVANNVYQVPDEVFPRPDGAAGCLPSESNLVFSVVTEPFSFAVARKDSGETLFNTSGSDLVFESQYLRLRTQLPDQPHLYGLDMTGEHTDPFMLNTSDYTRTFWNRDAYGTPAGSNLYGHHDIYFDHRGDKGTHGVFLLNSNGADIKINDTAGQYLEYNTLGGVFDFYFLNGPEPRDVSRQYAEIAKLPALQPYWGLGYHNCRYGYQDAYAVAEVIANYSKAGIPLETMWTDIVRKDYMELRRTFSLDPERFPIERVREIVDYLHDHQQHYIVMVDPAMYAGPATGPSGGAYSRGVEQNVFLKEDNGSVYHGVVWPGVTAFPDWFNPDTQDFWNSEFQMFFDADSGVDIDALWIDMNEPSNFCTYPCSDPAAFAISSGNPPAPPEVRPESVRPISGFPGDFQPPGLQRRAVQDGAMMGLPDRELLDPPYHINNAAGIISNLTSNTNLVHSNGLVMYDTHDMYGSMMSSASRIAMEARRPTKRPLIITRSTFAGAGKDVGHWLGDNLSTWFHYRISIAQMIAFSSMFQIPMVGADICGFGGNTTDSLCARWALLGAFYPFMRNHNGFDSIAQEFYQKPLWTEAAKYAIDYRYRLLDYLYTAMWQQNQTGDPSISALYFTYPQDTNTFNISEQFFFGDSILVSPVVEENATSVDIYLPNDIFYDFFTYEPVQGQGAMLHLDNVSYTEIPVHIKGGSILPLRTNSANTTTELRKENFTIVVAPGTDGAAKGQLYVDDGESLVQNATSLITFDYSDKKFDMAGTFDYDVGVSVDAVIFLGQAQAPAVMGYGFDYNATSQALRVNIGQPLNGPLSFSL
ncbi:hypothetical protein FH972_024142 [Carpinus fangiana]|uniref:beta-glucosidase n=1 Tax=Carpinus fangiana TaxID=176857 RepID=A0A5N6KX70_9ROSI|nr:hypothetical protein FH972_024142 [Carpinus fangiana]